MHVGEMRVIPAKLVRPQRLKVAAYARVSTEHERQLSSIAAQVSHYSHLIQSTPGWDYAGVFIDEGITGTSTKHRDGFNDLMDTARAGGIDVILTKSISRLARNTVDLLDTVRELKALGVAVRFEREQIDTATADGELLLTLLASFAQEESRSMSKNVKWGIRKKYADGFMHSRQPYGYQYVGSDLVVIEAEAEIIRRIFTGFLAGISPEATAAQLNAEGITPRRGAKFRGKTIRKWLENEIYTGRVILQKYYRPKVSESNCHTNTGELPRYLVEESHPAIIDQATFDAVQAELARRRHLGRGATPSGGTTGLTSRIECSVCGRFYHRRTKKRRASTYKFWWCETATKGKGNPCRAPQIRETHLTRVCARVLGLDDWDDEHALTHLTKIVVNADRTLTIHTTSREAPVTVSLDEEAAR
ncbi:recombinase family protein [Trueperella pyogenes]|uniref:recombinase family protein n=1 Tax=Trueperella pyogenes TaxID=1661 RepID=UPI00324E6771